jgi:4-hydroxybenzoyl-CoA thioesterase
MTTEGRWTVGVTWGDCDAAGIVFYPNYFKWFDAATHAFFESIGFPHRRLQADFDAVGLVLVDARSSFRAPATYGDTLLISTTVTELGARRLVLGHRVTRGDVLICEGQEVRVFAMHGPDGRVGAQPLPEVLVDALR